MDQSKSAPASQPAPTPQAVPTRPRAQTLETITSAGTQVPRNELLRKASFASMRSLISVRRAITGEAVQLHPIAEISQRPYWKAGIEPGLDPTKENGGLPQLPTTHVQCIITAVDFDQDGISVRDLDNDSLHNYLDAPRGETSVCRWINVNGHSWDIIQALALEYSLSPLALEDLLHTKSRTKVDWYKNHMFIVLTLQKIMHLHTDEAANEIKQSKQTIPAQVLFQKIRNIFCRDRTASTLPTIEDGKISKESIGAVDSPYRTLQDYNGGENEERVEYLESQSLLKQEDLEVSVEQVSIFVTRNNEIISFFESSGQDIEHPIIKRLLSESTLIRQSADAAMIAQALIDGIIDLAIPVNTAFKNAIDKMELDVLTTAPDKKSAILFYILKSEMLAMKNLMSPITKVIQTLRNHRNLSSPVVKITEMTNAYLGDVEDHCISIEESLNQMLSTSSAISDLIFNTLNIGTNKTMKILTTCSVLLLPLQFLTGYFGMNFKAFDAINGNVSYFWTIAIPLMVFAFFLVQFRDVKTFLSNKKQRRIFQKKRVTREKRRKIRSYE